MNSEIKTWESLKQDYLKQVESAIRTTGNTLPREILDDVSAHLDQKFAELAPDQQNQQNFEKIIAEMGPASDYAELLGDKTITPGAQIGIWYRFVVNACLSIAVIIFIIVLAQVTDRILTPYYSYPVKGEPALPGQLEIATFQTLQGKYMDKLDYPFINDPNVLGKWNSVDFVWSPAEFVPGQQHWKRGFYFHWIWFAPNQQHFVEGFHIGSLNFLPNGAMTVPWQWTKGLLLKSDDNTANRYTIETIDGQQYMFLEWKAINYTVLHSRAGYYVLKKETAAEAANNQYVQKADQIVNLLAQNQFDKVEDNFDAAMKAALPTSRLVDVWQQLEKAGGPFKGIDGKSRLEQEGSMMVVFVPGTWQHNELDIKIVFDSNGKVSGLWTVAPAPRLK